jgi:hypothetical protein
MRGVGGAVLPAPPPALAKTERAITRLATTFISYQRPSPDNEARFWQGGVGLDRRPSLAPLKSRNDNGESLAG